MPGVQGMWIVGGVQVGRAWGDGDPSYACLDHDDGSPIAAAAAPVDPETVEVRRRLAYPPPGKERHPIVTDPQERMEALEAYHAALRLRDAVASGQRGVGAAVALWRWRTYFNEARPRA